MELFVDQSPKMSLQQFNESKHVSYMIDLLYRSRDQTGDVHFLYEHQGTTVVRIPAHKNVLAIGSTVLNDVFFGLRKLTGDIPTRSNTVTVETFEAFIALLYGKIFHISNAIFFFTKLLSHTILAIGSLVGFVFSNFQVNGIRLPRITMSIYCGYRKISMPNSAKQLAMNS